jgi:hypothetical protein
MNPSLFPEIPARPGALSEGSYDVLVLFARKTLLGGAGYLLLVTMGCALLRPYLSTLEATGASLFFLLLLAAVPLVGWGRQFDNAATICVMIPLAPSLSLLVNSLPRLVWWGVPIAAVMTALYVSFCGRSLSLSAMVWMGGIGAGLLVIISVVLQAIPRGQALIGWISSVAVLAYLAGETSAVLKRRTKDEGPAAVGDLIRGILRLVTYPVRVLLHWRSYRFEPFPGKDT